MQQSNLPPQRYPSGRAKRRWAYVSGSHLRDTVRGQAFKRVRRGLRRVADRGVYEVGATRSSRRWGPSSEPSAWLRPRGRSGLTSSPTYPPRSQARSRRLPSFARALPSARRRSLKTATSRRRLIGAAVLAGGCGLTAANSAVQQEAQAACLSASANITDLAAKKAADQACRAVGSGNAGQLAHAAIQAARRAESRAWLLGTPRAPVSSVGSTLPLPSQRACRNATVARGLAGPACRA